MKITYEEYEIANNYLTWLNNSCAKKKEDIESNGFTLTHDEYLEQIAEINDELHAIHILKCMLDNELE